jgi:hypothetical protein
VSEALPISSPNVVMVAYAVLFFLGAVLPAALQVVLPGPRERFGLLKVVLYALHAHQAMAIAHAGPITVWSSFLFALPALGALLLMMAGDVDSRPKEPPRTF